MTNILQAIETHSTYGRAAWLAKVTAAEIAAAAALLQQLDNESAEEQK